jgi:hypothetical protein
MVAWAEPQTWFIIAGIIVLVIFLGITFKIILGRIK